MHCYDISALSPAHGLNMVTTVMVYMAGSTVVLMLLSVYLSMCCLATTGSGGHVPLFPVIGEFII